jgi:hypothetical protein
MAHLEPLSVASQTCYLKVHLHEIFIYLMWFGQTDLYGLLINVYKVFNSPRYSTFSAFRVFSVYVRIRSVYSQCKNRFTLRILSKWTDLFRLFEECAETISNIRNWIIFFIAFKGKLLQNQYVYVQRDRILTRNKLLIHSSLTTKIMTIIMIRRGMIF